MAETKRHALIYGKRNSGKTPLTERLLAECRVPLYGFRTKIVTKRDDGFHQIYMFPAGEPDGPLTEENHIGDCNMQERTIHLSVFETLGVRLLETARPDGIILMDEIGFMEAEAPHFCRAVLDCLDGEIPVLATVKQSAIDVDFLHRVCAHPAASLYTLSPETKDSLYEELLPWIRKQNERNR
ncbi:MAG: nucleoside-triphosphatase [Oscillospiraceae bacterium]|nr:nucleoside-triphosphatase [Oscillospiraceae bacterium]